MVAGKSTKTDAAMNNQPYICDINLGYEKCEDGASEDHKRKLFDKVLGEAMGQIKDRGYHKKYIGSGKAVTLAAFAFLGRDEIEMRAESGG